MTAGQILRSLRTRMPAPTPLPEAEGPAAVAWAQGWWAGTAVGIVIGMALAVLAGVAR